MFALVDSLDHDSALLLRRRPGHSRAGSASAAICWTGQTSIGADADAYGMFFDVLPHAIRNATLLSGVAQLYEWYAR